MEQKSNATLLRIFISESDKLDHTPLYECIVKEARSAELAGATVWNGLMSFGPTSRIHSARILDLSSNLPIIIEIVDDDAKIGAFLPKLHDMFEKAQSGGLITKETVQVIKYTHGNA